MIWIIGTFLRQCIQCFFVFFSLLPFFSPCFPSLISWLVYTLLRLHNIWLFGTWRSPPRAFQYQHVLRSLCMCMSLSVCVLMACGCMSTLCNAPPTGHLKGDRAQHKALHSCRWEQLMRLFECVIHSTWKRGDFTVFFFCCIRYSFW